MKRLLLVTLGIGIGWILGVTLSLIILPLGRGTYVNVGSALFDTFLFGFPGLVLLSASVVLSMMDNVLDPYSGEF